MTLDEFIAKLTRTRRKWELRGELLRSGRHCPLSAVANVNPCDSLMATKKLGLSRHSAIRIVYAADGDDEPSLRARLLKACRIQERKTP